MNILIYVIMMMSLLAALTYAKMEGLRSMMLLKGNFVNYMAMSEMDASKRGAIAGYDAVHVIERTKSSSKKSPVKGAGQRLSLHCLLSPEAREASPEQYNQTRALLKSLMTNLYKDERFFQEMQSKNPNFLDDILNEIMLASEREPKQKIKNPEGLLNLVFSPQADDLHYSFYLMMHGKPCSSTTHEANYSNPVDASNEDSEDSDNAHADAGYVALIDFITVRSQVKKVRAYLASPELLMAIYSDFGIVKKIIEMRTELSREARRKKGRPLSELTEQFKSSFENAGQAPNFVEILDFSVTKTTPPKSSHSNSSSARNK